MTTVNAMQTTLKVIALLAIAATASGCEATSNCPDASEALIDDVAADAGPADAEVTDAAETAVDGGSAADANRRACDKCTPCQNGVCCGDDGYCFVPADDPLRCVYNDATLLPDAAVCD